MKKRLLAALLALGLLLGMARAEKLAVKEDMRTLVQTLLTGSYGYTAQEAEAFVIEPWKLENGVKLAFYPADHPEWRYTVKVRKGKCEESLSPFAPLDARERFPGERLVREGMRLAMEKWLPDWENAGRSALASWMWEKDIIGTARLQEGLETGNLSAGNALHELLVSCYGETFHWPSALLEWERETLLKQGLSLEAFEPGGVTRFTLQTLSRARLPVVRFAGDAPEELGEALNHPALTGWTLLCGCVLGERCALAAFEQGDRRLLLLLSRSRADRPWKLYSMGENALYTGRPFFITAGSDGRMFEIVYPISATERELFAIYHQDKTDTCRLDGYLRVNDETREGIEIAANTETGYSVTVTYADGRHQQKAVEKAARCVLPDADVNSFPTTLDACWQAPDTLVPPDCGVTHEVHLRAHRSSRSKDLGLYHAGTVVRILDEEPGEPNNWYHVRVGSVEGYMSCAYVVDVKTHPCAVTAVTALPVGKAKGDIRLKDGMSWFASTVQILPAGTRMHVLAECGQWLHVMLLEDGNGWIMEVEGTDGYIRSDEITYVSLTALN